MIKKANLNDKIKLIHDVVYGSSYGSIELPINTTLTVSERLRTDDGVVTKEIITLKNELGEKNFQYTIWDSSYEII